MTAEVQIVLIIFLLMVVLPLTVGGLMFFLEKMGAISSQIDEAERDMIAQEQNEYYHELEEDLWKQLL